MNKTILIGSLISCSILLLTTISPIVHYSKAQEATKDALNEYITNSVGMFSPSQFIQRHLSSNDDTGIDDPQPLCFPFLGIFIYGLIAYIMSKIIGLILRDIGSIIRGVIRNIMTSVGHVIINIITTMGLFVQLLIIVIQVIFTLLFNTGEFIGLALYAIVTAIFAIILFIFNVLGSLLQRSWQGIATFFGLILDILRLIYDTIFTTRVVA